MNRIKLTKELIATAKALMDFEKEKTASGKITGFETVILISALEHFLKSRKSVLKDGRYAFSYEAADELLDKLYKMI